MCIDIKYNDKGKILNNTIVPISDDWSSVNWYTRRANYFTKNIIGDKASKISAKRDYSKEIPICNIQYIDQGSTDSPVIGTVNNKLRFTILPKPLVYINPKNLQSRRFYSTKMVILIKTENTLCLTRNLMRFSKKDKVRISNLMKEKVRQT